jgi:colicin import membrane protein
VREAEIATEKHPTKPTPDPKKEAAAKEAALKEKADAKAKADADAKAEAKAKAKTKAEADAKAEAKAEAREAREAKQAEDQRRKILAEMRDQMHGSNHSSQAYSPSAGYAGRVRARIFPNIVYTGRAMGNPTTEVEIGLSPDGTILNTRLIRSSGIADWDDAVLRAIERTAQLPLDIDGHIPAKMVLSFDPNKR